MYSRSNAAEYSSKNWTELVSYYTVGRLLCRDSADMQYTTTKKIYQKLKTINLYDNLPFIFECFMTYNIPSCAKKHRKQKRKTKRKKVTRQPTSFLSSSSDRRVQKCMTPWWFSGKTAAFYTEQCTSPSLFHNHEVSWHGSNRSLNDYGFISNAIFTNHLATKKWLFVHEDRESRLASIVDGVFEVWTEPVNDSSANTDTSISTEEACENRPAAL